MTMSIFETVQTVLKANNLACLKNINADLLKQLEASSKTKMRSVDDLLAAIKDDKSSFARNFASEYYVPNFAGQLGKFTAIS